MPMKKCFNCSNEVPHEGQCNSCGFVDGLSRMPTDDQYKRARAVNEEIGYEQYKNIDMLLLD